MVTHGHKKIVELPEIIRSSTHNMPLERETNADVYRQMDIGDAVEIPEISRNGKYIAACKAAPKSKFTTRKKDCKVYLMRIA